MLDIKENRVNMEDQSSVQDHRDRSTSENSFLNEDGLWNDDLRLLVTVQGTDYLFEKYHIEENKTTSNQNKVWSSPKKARIGKSTLHTDNAKLKIRDNAIRGLFPRLTQDSLCVKPDVTKEDIHRTIESAVELQIRLGKELHSTSGFTELLEKKKAVFSYILDTARVKYKCGYEKSVDFSNIPDDNVKRVPENVADEVQRERQASIYSIPSAYPGTQDLDDDNFYSRPSSSFDNSSSNMVAGNDSYGTVYCGNGSRTGSNALVELGVTTGLSLLFALMRQNWMAANAIKSMNLHSGDNESNNTPYLQLVGGGSMICNQVLRTARTVLLSLPPLSLSNSNSKIPDLGETSLDQVSEFLSHTSSPLQTGGDVEGAQLCSEILLLLAVQRGRLSQILVWIHTCLRISSNGPTTKFSKSVIKMVLRQMQVITNVPVDETQRKVWHTKESLDNATLEEMQRFPNEDVNQHDAALFILSHLVSQTSAYTSMSIISSISNTRRSVAPFNLTSNSFGHKQVEGIQKMEAYLWGSNSSHQLAEGAREKFLSPKLTNSFRNVLKLEAGQYCTFVLHTDGRVSGCGKGSYGRLGLGDSSNQINPRILPISSPVKYLSSSRGSDGHTLALTENGQIYSWGDGDYGKLGHGNTSTQKLPKRVMGPLADKVVVQISAGYRHSAAVTDDGFLYTWGEGDFGRLGHGDSQSRFIPTLVKELSDGDVGQVSCGASHTLALSADGRIIWAFGSGDNGKLGHGDAARLYRPKAIDSIQGLFFQKIQAGGSVSLALTTSGQIWSWGTGPCIGRGPGPSESSVLLPTLIDTLVNVSIVDISLGDAHCLVLAQDCSVYSWGLNSMGQCGLGHNSPVVTPQRISTLDGIPIHQISAGTSHSMAWTTLPPDRSAIPWHKPFCIDNSHDTFKTIIGILKEFGFHPWVERKTEENESESKENENKGLESTVLEERERFILSVLNILIPHLSILNNQANTQANRIQLRSSKTSNDDQPMIAGFNENAKNDELKNTVQNEMSVFLKTELVSVLHRFLDLSSCPKKILCAVEECLYKGIHILLPSVYERIKKACMLLELDHELMKPSQEVELKLILQSLNDPTVIGSLLKQSSLNAETNETQIPHSHEKLMANDIMLLLRILLRKAILYSGKKLESSLAEDNPKDNTKIVENKVEASLIDIEMSLLFTLHTHFVLANLNDINCDTITNSFTTTIRDMAVEYLKLLFLLCHDLFEQCFSAINAIQNVEVLKDEESNTKALSLGVRNIFSPESTSTAIHILHLTLVKLYDAPANFIKTFLSQLVEFQRSSIMFLDTVINCFLCDENR